MKSFQGHYHLCCECFQVLFRLVRAEPFSGGGSLSSAVVFTAFFFPLPVPCCLSLLLVCLPLGTFPLICYMALGDAVIAFCRSSNSKGELSESLGGFPSSEMDERCCADLVTVFPRLCCFLCRTSWHPPPLLRLPHLWPQDKWDVTTHDLFTSVSPRLPPKSC